MHPLIWLPLGVILAAIARVYVIVRTPRGFVPRKRAQTETCHLAVFLGSGKLHIVRSTPRSHPSPFFHLGGHSSEALTLVSALDFSRYTPRTYIVSEGDHLSERKAVALERLKATASSSSAACASSPLASAALYLLSRFFPGDKSTDPLAYSWLPIALGCSNRISRPHHSPRQARAPEPPHDPVHRPTFAPVRHVSRHPRPSAFPRRLPL